MQLADFSFTIWLVVISIIANREEKKAKKQSSNKPKIKHINKDAQLNNDVK